MLFYAWMSKKYQTQWFISSYQNVKHDTLKTGYKWKDEAE